MNASHPRLFLAGMALFCFLQPAFAQVQFSEGLLAGINWGALEIIDFSTSDKRVDAQKLTGFEAGAYMKAHLNPFYFKPVIMVSSQYGQADYYAQPGIYTTVQQVSIAVQRIKVPLLLGITIVGPLNIDAGPCFEYIITPQLKPGGDLKTGALGLGFRINTSIVYKRWAIYVGYEGLANTFSSEPAAVKDIYYLSTGISFRAISDTDKE